jgi:hypothetical protein
MNYPIVCKKHFYTNPSEFIMFQWLHGFIVVRFAIPFETLGILDLFEMQGQGLPCLASGYVKIASENGYL